MMQEETLLNRLLKRAYNNKVIVAAVVLSMVIVGVATLTESISKMVGIVAPYFEYKPTQNSAEAPQEEAKVPEETGQPGQEHASSDSGRLSTKTQKPISTKGPVEDVDTRIEDLLRQAKASLEELQLTIPEKGSAYSLYQKVLELDPENKDAKSGITKVAEEYVRLAQSALDGGDSRRARHYRQKAHEVEPNVQGLGALDARIAKKERASAPEEGELGRIKALAAAVSTIYDDESAKKIVITGINRLPFQVTMPHIETVVRDADVYDDEYAADMLVGIVDKVKRPVPGGELAKILDIADIYDDEYYSSVVAAYAKLLKYPLSSQDIKALLSPISSDWYSTRTLEILMDAETKQGKE